MELDVTGLKDGNVAGFGIFEFPYAYVAVCQEGGARKIVMCNDNTIVETIVKMGLGLPWTANRFALFNFTTSPQGVDGCADFNWFHFNNK